MDDADLDRLAELAACMVGSAAAELIAGVLPRRDGEELPDLRNRLARAALRTPTGPTLVANDGDTAIANWLGRLPVADRVLLTLRYGEHLTSGEVARIIDLPPAEIESRLAALTRDVPAPAEAYLSFGLARLAESTPGPAELAHTLMHTTHRRNRRRRAVAGLLALTAMFSLLVAVAVQVGRRPTDLAFANPGTWQLVHQVDTPPGWAVAGYSLTRNDETTWVRRGDHECNVKIRFWSTVEPWPEIRLPSRPVLLGHRRADLVGSTEVRLDGWGGRMTVVCPPEVGVDGLVQLARSVRFAATPIRVPLSVRELSSGTQLVGIDVVGGTTWVTFGRPYFTLHVTPRPGRSDCPPSPLPYPDPGMLDGLYLDTPDGAACADLRWVSRPDRPTREHAYRSVRELSKLLELADPADPESWFDPQDMLPPR